MTNISFKHLETYKSDKIIEINNVDFINAIFGNDSLKEQPILVSFKGHPAHIEKKNWYGYPLTNADSLELLPDANNYFSLARFKPNESGGYQRKKSYFHSLHAIMLDDVGTKVSLERLTLKPSWLIETSPNNYQAGYILNEAISNSNEADQLMNAVIYAGLCDPGANSVTTRLARLPIAANGKHSPVFLCQLKIWAPQNRYSMQTLVNGLQLEIIEKPRLKRINTRKDDQHTDNDQIWIPRPNENPILTALQKRNLYKSPLGENKHDITCPWVSVHTDAIDNGTAYFEPDDQYPLGGFKCQHGHCNEKRIRDLLDFLDIDITSARMKPTIRVVKGEINCIIDHAELELAATKQFYQQRGVIVTVYTDPSTHETLIRDISKPALVRALASVASWEQFDKRSKELVRIDPPDRHAIILHNSGSYRHLPVINGLARQPYLRPDGSLMKLAGYDFNTGIFGVFDSRKFNIPDHPTREDAKSALKILMEPLEEFCFVTNNDKSAALSTMLTASIRPSLANAPMTHVRAHTIGSGKSYLCELMTAFATSQRGTPSTFPADDEECRKLMLAELSRSTAVINFDNLTSNILPHKSLCAAITSEFINIRILGFSKIATVSTRVQLLSSGNNVSPIKDMTRRCLVINLNPEAEIPINRKFKRPNLISEVLNDRERYVSAALIIVRAWISAGRPKTKCKPLAGFGDWSDLCRQSLLWLELADPAASIFEGIKTDPDREKLNRLLTAWRAIFGSTPTMIREAVIKSNFSGKDNNELKEIMHDIAGERNDINRLRLGRWIRRHEGQLVNGMRFIRYDGNTSAEQWQVKSVSPVLSLSTSAPNKTVTEDSYRRATEGE